MINHDLFENLLATYPAERRDLARQIYNRFAEGDSTQFFTQLFMALDLYAHFTESVPRAVMEANQSARAQLTKLHEEMCLLAQMIDKRNLNITNHVEKTDELCQQAVSKCDETLSRFEALLKNIGAYVDTQFIVQGIQRQLETGIRAEIITPFVNRSRELATQTVSTLTAVREAASEASRLWPRHIWKTAWTSCVLSALALTTLATVCIYAKFKNYFEEKMAEKIVQAERSMNYNKDAFRELAIAGVLVKVLRTESYGVTNPSAFALIIEGADGVELRPDGGHKNGCIFFSSSRTEKQIQQIHQELRNLPTTNRPAAAQPDGENGRR